MCVLNNSQGLGVQTYKQLRSHQLIGEYCGGVEKAEAFKYTDHTDVMSLLDSRYPSRSRCVCFQINNI